MKYLLLTLFIAGCYVEPKKIYVTQKESFQDKIYRNREERCFQRERENCDARFRTCRNYDKKSYRVCMNRFNRCVDNISCSYNSRRYRRCVDRCDDYRHYSRKSLNRCYERCR